MWRLKLELKPRWDETCEIRSSEVVHWRQTIRLCDATSAPDISQPFLSTQKVSEMSSGNAKHSFAGALVLLKHLTTQVEKDFQIWDETQLAPEHVKLAHIIFSHLLFFYLFSPVRTESGGWWRWQLTGSGSWSGLTFTNPELMEGRPMNSACCAYEPLHSGCMSVH